MRLGLLSAFPRLAASAPLLAAEPLTDGSMFVHSLQHRYALMVVTITTYGNTTAFRWHHRCTTLVAQSVFRRSTATRPK
jgi:hypothetical protein